jgi:adhesin transport system outer membrane protein
MSNLDLVMVITLNDVCRARRIHAGGFAALLLASGLAAPAAAQLLLPTPEPNPQAIDFSVDPLLAFLAAAADPAAFRAAIAEAVARHPATGEADAGSDVAREVRREARSALFPNLNAGLVGTRSLSRDFQGNGAIVESLGPRGRTDASIGVDQLIADFGATSGRIAGASARLRGAEADADRAAIATGFAAIEAWYQVLGYRTALDLDEALIERHRRILADTRARVAAGLGAGGDIARAEAGLADAIVAGARTARTLATVRASYREAFGGEAPARPRRPARPQSAATDPATAMAMAHSAPPVVAALAAAEAARGDARASRGDMLPRLTAGVNGTMYSVFESGRNYDIRGVAALRQAFSTGGAESARLAQAKARARAAAFAADRVTAEAERDAETAFADVRILDGSAAALEDAYRANRRSRDTMAEQFRLSRGSLIDLLRSEQEFFAAARALLQGNLERDLAHYALLARTGELPGQFDLPTEVPANPGTSR